jgi:hypothetical protein
MVVAAFLRYSPPSALGFQHGRRLGKMEHTVFVVRRKIPLLKDPYVKTRRCVFSVALSDCTIYYLIKALE